MIGDKDEDVKVSGGTDAFYDQARQRSFADMHGQAQLTAHTRKEFFIRRDACRAESAYALSLAWRHISHAFILAVLALAEKEAIEHELVVHNMPFVFFIARQYAWRCSHMSFFDLVQEGMVGLMKAVQKFDYRRGYQFSTYALWWVRQSMHCAQIAQEHAIPRTDYLRGKIRRVIQAENQIYEKEGRAADDEEIAVAAKLPVQSIAELRMLGRESSMLSLSSKIHDRHHNQHHELQDLLADERIPDFSEMVQQSELRDMVRGAIDSLTEREAVVLRKRFGIEDDEPHTLQEIGKDLGYSHETIRQIEKEARRKLGQFLSERLYEYV